MEELSKLTNGVYDYFLISNDGKIYSKAIEHIEKIVIEKVLERTFGNQFKAAKILGINRNTLRSKIHKLNIDARKWKVY
ncbi:MAG: helix-turn-helix domain-containing protein [Candidatus Omnitrophota bacterium]|nr:helix-turn-helix domain-containing protein [Candidatus Omnitrophota bacterium]